MDELSEEDKIEVARARKIERFLSQTFQDPEVFASNHGKLVPGSETISGFEEVMAGKFGNKPEVAFHKAVGSVTKFDNLEQKVEDRKPVAVVHVAMTEDELVKNEYFAMNFLVSLADAVTEKVPGRNQVRDQGGGDQDYTGNALGVGLAEFDDAPDVSGLRFPYIYERDFGSDEPVLFEVDTSDEVIAMMMAMGTDLF